MRIRVFFCLLHDLPRSRVRSVLSVTASREALYGHHAAFVAAE